MNQQLPPTGPGLNRLRRSPNTPRTAAAHQRWRRWAPQVVVVLQVQAGVRTMTTRSAGSALRREVE
ncbi:hypothetical protein NLX62_02190 [Mycobacteriaceae bacterium Msp059]|nr:hypothetical protein [Mycobacteriaceae bacterium Msp059]